MELPARRLSPAAGGLVHGLEARTAQAWRGSALLRCRRLAQTELAGLVAAIRYGRGGGRSPPAAPRGVRPGKPIVPIRATPRVF